MMKRLVAVALLAAATLPVAADTFGVDPFHSSITFMISHANVGQVHGRFNDLLGTFVLEDDAAKSSFALTIKTDSVDSNNKPRDTHLKSPDFFNVKQHPTITFQSTAVKKSAKGYDVTGDFTMCGVKKSIVVPLEGGKMTEFPKGTPRTGFTAELTLKRSDFGMTGGGGQIGDDVRIFIGVEAVKRK